MRDAPSLALAAIAGALLGLFYFGGLWWTVRRGLSLERPALLFLGSLVFRTAVVLSGFYLVSHGQSGRIVACLFGFIAARLIVVRRFMPPAHAPANPEARDAHQS